MELFRRFDRTRLGQARRKWSNVYNRKHRWREQLERAERRERQLWAALKTAEAEDRDGVALDAAIEAERDRQAGVPF